MKSFDPSLYLLTNHRYFKNRTLLESVHQAILGGVTLVQLRDKFSPHETLAQLTRALLILLKPYKIPLILNDHVEIAKECGADGVHLGIGDLHPDSARKILGNKAIIGYSVESNQDFRTLPLNSVDYIAASPVFPSINKKDTEAPFSKEQLQALRQKTPLPLVAIGGITLKNLESLLESKVDGIATISAILGASDIVAASRQLKEKINSFRKKTS